MNKVELNENRQSEELVERISGCNVIEKLAEHGIQSLPNSYSSDVIDLFSIAIMEYPNVMLSNFAD